MQKDETVKVSRDRVLKNFLCCARSLGKAVLAMVESMALGWILALSVLLTCSVPGMTLCYPINKS